MNHLLKQAMAEVSTPVEEPIAAQMDFGEVQASIDSELEAQASFQAILDTEDAIEQAETVASQVRTLIAELRVNADDGGMTARTAAMYGIATQGIYGPFGGPEAIGNTVAGIENFEEDGGRVQATMFAIEAEEGTLKKVAKAIKDFFKNIANMLKKFWVTNFTNVGRLKKQVTGFKDSLKDVDGSLSDKTIKLGGKSVWLAKDGGVNQGKLVSDLDELAKFVEGVSKSTKVNKLASQAIKEMEKLDFEKDKEGALKSLIESMKSVGREQRGRYSIDKQFKGDSKKLYPKMEDGDQVLTSGQFLGNKEIVALDTTKSSENDFDRAAEKVFMTLDVRVIEAEKNSFDKDTEINLLEKSDIVKVCDSVEKICDAFMAFRTEEKEIDDIEKAVSKAIDSMATYGEKSGENRTMVKMLLKSVKLSLPRLTTPPTKVGQHATSVAKVAMKVAVASVASIKSDGKGTKDDKDGNKDEDKSGDDE